MNKEFCIELYQKWSKGSIPIFRYALIVNIPEDVLFEYLVYGKYLIEQQS